MSNKPEEAQHAHPYTPTAPDLGGAGLEYKGGQLSNVFGPVPDGIADTPQEDLSPVRTSLAPDVAQVEGDIELPPIPKPITTSEFWDAGIDRPLAGERAVRLERERQLKSALQQLRNAAALQRESDDLVKGLKEELSKAKADHGKTLLLLNAAAFETIPKLESQLASIRAGSGERPRTVIPSPTHYNPLGWFYSERGLFCRASEVTAALDARDAHHAALHSAMERLHAENVQLKARVGKGEFDTLAIQKRTREWVESRLGAAAMDTHERSMRSLEENFELAQSFDVSITEALRLLIHVYSKPPGDPGQELGGATLTLLGCAEGAGYVLSECALTELARIEMARPEKFRRRQDENAAKGIGAPLDPGYQQSEGEGTTEKGLS